MKSKPRITKEIKLRTIDSKIITCQHVELISKWIDRLEITDKLTSSYDFADLVMDLYEINFMKFVIINHAQ